MSHLESWMIQGIPTLRVFGDLNFHSSGEVGEAAKVLLASSGSSSLLIDLEHSPLVDSSGLGTLLVCHNLCASRNGTLMLIGVDEHLRRVLRVTRLDSHFVILSGRIGGIRNHRLSSMRMDDTGYVPSSSVNMRNAWQH